MRVGFERLRHSRLGVPAGLALILVSRAAAEDRDAPGRLWSLRKLARPEVPAVGRREWARTPIDAFVLEKLEARGLEPAPPAEPAVLVRRATFDLLGIPPTPEEVSAFESDPSPEAYERLLDRLLASPRYGERWGRHWLDVARFSESQGFEYDKIRDNAYWYRDYVIRSLNEDKPYTRFIREQIAGDVLEPVTRDGIAATGFLVAGPWDEAGNLQQSVVMRTRAREEELEDIIGTVGQTFLGLTVNCARCHDHKFDPIPQRDYYRLKAVFGGVRHGERPLLTPDESRELARLRAEIASKGARLREVERTARRRALSRPPLARWTFEVDGRDEEGDLQGTLEGAARVAGGRLVLDGKGSFLRTEPLRGALREKTFEAWVSLASLTQRGGGVISLETSDGKVFDALVFGEREERKWFPGSDSFSRSRDLEAPLEEAPPGKTVHLALVYGSAEKAGNRIALYRNGKLLAEPYVSRSPLPAFPREKSRVLIGLRHTGAGNGFFAGSIEEACLHDRPLSPEEIEASFRAGPQGMPPEEIVRALGEREREERARLLEEISEARAALRALGEVPLAYAGRPEKPPPTFVLIRGDVEKPGEPVTAGGLSAVSSPPADFGLDEETPEGARRARFAEWLSSPENPLPARVMVNRVWHHHFGRGLVATPGDFGLNGDPPSHPQLLDWLASGFIAGGWRLKPLHKLIMLSSAYRQSSRSSPATAAVDGENRLLWRFAPRRLEAEAVRDSMLCASGAISFRMGGPGFRPFKVRVFNSHFYDLTDPEGPEYDRRTVYRIGVNSAKDPLLDSLDCPDPWVRTPSRAITTTPLQSLGLMNGSFVIRQCRLLAARLEQGGDGSLHERVDLAYRIALGRAPSAAERERARELCGEHGLSSLAWALFNSSEFLYLR